MTTSKAASPAAVRAMAAAPSSAAISPGPTAQTLVIEHFPRPDTARALSPNGRVHWATRKRHVDHVHRMVTINARLRPFAAMTGHVVMYPRFIYPEHRVRDDDNLATGVMKAVRDALVKGGWLEADDTTHLRQMPVEVVVEKGRRALELRFEVSQ